MEDNIKTLPYIPGKLVGSNWTYQHDYNFKKSVLLIALDMIKYNANNTTIDFEDVEKVYDKLISKLTK